jgi:hypothetical protein
VADQHHADEEHGDEGRGVASGIEGIGERAALEAVGGELGVTQPEVVVGIDGVQGEGGRLVG